MVTLLGFQHELLLIPLQDRCIIRIEVFNKYKQNASTNESIFHILNSLNFTWLNFLTLGKASNLS